VTDDLAFFIDQCRPTIDEPHRITTLLQGGELALYFCGVPQIVCVDRGDEVAVRCSDATIAGRRDAGIALPN
jgi:hypothetical protein